MVGIVLTFWPTVGNLKKNSWKHNALFFYFQPTMHRELDVDKTVEEFSKVVEEEEKVLHDQTTPTVKKSRKGRLIGIIYFAFLHSCDGFGYWNLGFGREMGLRPVEQGFS